MEPEQRGTPVPPCRLDKVANSNSEGSRYTPKCGEVQRESITGSLYALSGSTRRRELGRAVRGAAGGARAWDIETYVSVRGTLRRKILFGYQEV